MTKRPWFVLSVKARQEKTVAQMLRRRGFEECVPLYAAGSNKSEYLPMFPGYVFCRFDSIVRDSVLTTPGITSIVSAGQVSNQEIETIRTIVASGLPARPWQYVGAGQIVRVEGGALAGVQGILLREQERMRIVISVKTLRRSVAIAIEREKICAVQGGADAPTARLYLSA
jgi:transcription antitermination factor NusG